MSNKRTLGFAWLLAIVSYLVLFPPLSLLSRWRALITDKPDPATGSRSRVS